MTEIALENLQGWVSGDWDPDAAKKISEQTNMLANILKNK
jgi:hypothetical protein